MPYRGTRVVWRGDAIEAAVIDGAARGLNRAAERLQAIVIPFTPYLDGDLTAGYGVHQADATEAGIVEGAQLQNSVKYAAYQHEGGDGHRVIRRHTHDPHPLARTKFVEVPMREHADELQAIIALEIQGALG